jgi:hypothetical protein
LQLTKTNEDPKTKSEIKIFEFLLGIAIWYDRLFAYNFVGNNLYLKDNAYWCCYISIKIYYLLF